MAEQLPTSTFYNTPYKFNGKELDEETGLYYYGARYYDPRISIWYSVDPLAEKHPDYSAYTYCANNPVVLVDPDGRDWYVGNTTGQYKWFDGSDKQKGYTNVGNNKVTYDENANQINVYEGKNSTFKESISMSTNKGSDGKFLSYKSDRAAKFAILSAESGGANVHDNDPFFGPLIISASIDNRQRVADGGVNSYNSYTNQAYRGYQAKGTRSYKSFADGNQSRFNDNMYYQNLGLCTIYNAMDSPVEQLTNNYSMSDASNILYYSHIGGHAQSKSAYNIAFPSGKSNGFFSIQGDNKYKVTKR
jgi:RHS repeat-associated protein